MITSNFEKLRFYINNAVDFEEFDLFTIDEKGFELMYICLAAENVLNNIPLRIKEASLAEEESITKKFYADYSLFKRELFRDLVKRNLKNEALRGHLIAEDVVKADKNIKMTLFKKSQKLIDRFLFVFFAEDRGLVPPNTTKQILSDYKKLQSMDAHVPLYNRFKLYFNYLDTGRKGTDQTAEIFAYNGGLFQPDNTLDSLLIDDELLYKHTNILSNYDFESQVDVNILGHIFENSLNEIESVNAEIEGTDFDKQKTKRKKDGVFYTPKYITKYIVDNTVGKLCEEKKDELGITGEDFSPKRQKETKRQLLEKLENYREWLLQLTICDPACGSGAFLNQALDFLITEHEFIDELQAAVLGNAIVFQEIENTILENNIYGVDLNEESVEIAKLSLWLRTAQPRRKLNSLNDNIKCGNSLIDSKAVAGDKAFKWEDEFPEVFKKGGFDVVIGNPPYVRNEYIENNAKEYLEKNYEVFTGKSDLYTFFFEKVERILKIKGLSAFIVSSKYTKTKYGKVLIDFLQSRTKIEIFIDFQDLDIFTGIVAYPSIIITKKLKIDPNISNSRLLVVNNENYQEFENLIFNSINVKQIELFERLGSWTSDGVGDEMFNLIKKLEIKFKPLELVIKKPQVGIKTGSNSAFIFDKDEIPIKIKESKLLKEYLVGREVKRYGTASTANVILAPYNFKNGKLELIKDSENLNELEFLEDKRDLLSKRAIIDKGIINGSKKWFEFQQLKVDFPFHEKYIVYPDISSTVNFTFADNVLLDMTCFGIPSNSKSLLGILNSNLMKSYLNSICVKARGGYLRLKSQYILRIPLPDNYEVISLDNQVEQILLNSGKLEHKIKTFSTYVQSQFSIEKLSQKLQSWHHLTFSDFIKELNKAIKTAKGTPLTKLQEMEWMEVFEVKKKEALELKAEIDRTDKEIDEMVYALYGLTDEEIAIVENSSN